MYLGRCMEMITTWDLHFTWLWRYCFTWAKKYAHSGHYHISFAGVSSGFRWLLSLAWKLAVIFAWCTGQISLTGTPLPGCHGMISPLWSMERRLVTWHVTSSSAGTSQRYTGGFIMTQSTWTGAGREEETPRGLARRGCSGHSCALHLLLGAWLSEHLGFCAKEMVLNFHCTDHLKHRRKGATIRANGLTLLTSWMLSVDWASAQDW